MRRLLGFCIVDILTLGCTDMDLQQNMGENA